MTDRVLPEIVQRYWYSIDWDVETLWSLDLPVTTFQISELDWHMDVPVWPDAHNTPYSATPNEVLAEPESHSVEFARINSADLTFPIEVAIRGDRKMILDGVHRLARTIAEGRTTIKGRVVPESAIREL